MGVVQDGLVLWLDARAQRQLMKIGQNDSVWKDLSGNGNDCEVHREVFEYPPVLDGGRNLYPENTGTHFYPNFVGISPFEERFIEDGKLIRRLSLRERVGISYYSLYISELITNFTEGKEYTLSCEVRPNVDLHVSIVEGRGYTLARAGEWTRISYTTRTDRRFGMYSLEKATEIYPVFLDVRNLKIEEGPVATPWTPAPEDLGLEYPDWIQNFYPGLKDRWYENKLYFISSDSHIQVPEINLNPDNFTIQVDNRIRAFNGDKVTTENGDEWGRNLILNSNYFPLNGSDYGNTNLTEIKIDENGEEYFSVVPINDGNIYWYQGMKFSEPRYKDQVYTFSFDVMTEQDENWGFLFYTDRRRKITNIPSTKGKWVRYTYTFTQEETRNDNIVFGFTYLKAGKEIGWRKLKLEKGSVATPWTPAPEDIAEINIINRNTPLVENNTIHTLRFYNRALTDEEILQNYRATHFLLEPKTFTSNDYYNYYDLNRVEINTLATKDLAEVLRGDINLEDIDFDRDMKSIPFADVLNKIEKNINTLGNKLYKHKGWTQPKLDWGYNQPFSYEDANRLERNLLLLYNYAKGNIDNIPHCGQIYIGEEVI